MTTSPDDLPEDFQLQDEVVRAAVSSDEDPVPDSERFVDGDLEDEQPPAE